jgi:hypothetical protein
VDDLALRGRGIGGVLLEGRSRVGIGENVLRLGQQIVDVLEADEQVALVVVVHRDGGFVTAPPCDARGKSELYEASGNCQNEQ